MPNTSGVNFKAFDSRINRRLNTVIELIGLVIILIAGSYIFLNQNLSNLQQYKYFAEIGGPGILLVLIAGISAALNSRRNYSNSLDKFLKDNNYKFINGLTKGDVPPSVKELGATFKFKECFAGKFSGSDFRFCYLDCEYLHSVAAGSTVMGGPMMIAGTKHQYPRIDLAKYGNNFLEYPMISSVANKGMVRLELEGDFNKNFFIRVEKGSEIEAEELFTPDFMAQLEDLKDCADFTISGNKIYIMCGAISYDSKSLESIFATASLIMTKLERH
jgi:hypothetical protein